MDILDRLESGTIAKALFRSSTALCLTKLNFDLKFLIQVQSSKPIKTKMPLITQFLRRLFVFDQATPFFYKLVSKNCGNNGVNFMFGWRFGASHMGPKTACAALWQKEERFPYKPASNESGDSRFFYDNPFGSNWCTLLQLSTTNFFMSLMLRLARKPGLQCFRSLEHVVGKGIFVNRIDFKIL